MVKMSSEISFNENTSNDGYISKNRELADQVINKFTAKSTPKIPNKRTAPIVKDDEEYQKKRARNNVAVKKSREKAKNRIQETQVRVEQLSKENEELQTKVNLLSKELNVLRALFTNGGFTLPDLHMVNNNSPTPSEHKSSINYSPHSRLSGDESGLSQSLHVPYDGEKSYHLLDDQKTSSKIPPLRPTPRIPSTSPVHQKHHPPIIHHPPAKAYSERIYSQNLLSKQDYIQKDSKNSSTGPPLLIQTGHDNNIHNLQQTKGDARHPSVIRSTTDVNGANTLGKFCIIQDSQGDKQIKIVPISS